MSDEPTTARPSEANPASSGQRRGRSARYPGMPLGEAIAFCERIDARGLDGLPAAAIAEGLGYSNVRTNTFSSGLSSARQFGLLALEGDRYTLTALGRSILHPIDPSELPRLYRRAFLEAPLYASLAGRYAGRRLPDAAALANVLYHHDQITAAAKRPAAEAFLASARFAGLVDAAGILRTDGPEPGAGAAGVSDAPPAPELQPSGPDAPALPAARAAAPPPLSRTPAPVRIDLMLWGADAGKVVRVRAPESMTPESFERLLAALRLHIRIDDGQEQD